MSPVTRRRLGHVLAILTPAAAIAVWWVWSGSADSFYFPPLQDILRTFVDVWLGPRLVDDVLPSLRRLVLGYALAALLGVGLGVLLGRSPGVRRATGPILEFLRAIPPPLLIPVGMLVLGVGDGMKIAVIALVCLFPVLLNTTDGVRGVDPVLLDTGRTYGLSRGTTLRRIVLPAAAPQIVAGLRTSLAMALILMVISEMVASQNGIGFTILQAQRTFALPEMWSGILLLGILGVVLNALFALFERRALRWQRGARRQQNA
jgi:ABC-type nitrate/sulfonate/bicarbonate transport system permease component